MKTAIYPGSFDPITYGHLNIIERAVALFDRLIVVIGDNFRKSHPLFSVEERMVMIRETTRAWEDQVSVERLEGLLVNKVRETGAQTIVRGLRAATDFDYEFEMVLANRQLDPSFESVFLMPNSQYIYLSSSIVKEVVGLGGDASPFVPPFVAEKLRVKLEKDVLR
ncbi:MAG: pantetheine-phosphate adenylyltransferase [Candidatus Latescibacterota bacterium]